MERVALGSDHAGYELKMAVEELLKELGVEYHDFGCHSTDSVDYPDYAHPVALAVAKGDYPLGILICGTGIGMSIAANKLPGVRAALCGDVYSARLSREHNDANVLCMGGLVVGRGLGLEITRAWLGGRFTAGRHVPRLNKIKAIEEEFSRVR